MTNQKNDPLNVEYDFTVEKVQTRKDNGYRIWIDLPEGQLPQATLFMDGHRRGVVFSGQAVEQFAKEKHEARTTSRTKAKRRKQESVTGV